MNHDYVPDRHLMTLTFTTALETFETQLTIHYFKKAPCVLSGMRKIITLKLRLQFLKQHFYFLMYMYLLILGKPVMIVIEFMENGALDAFLRVSNKIILPF